MHTITQRMMDYSSYYSKISYSKLIIELKILDNLFNSFNLYQRWYNVRLHFVALWIRVRGGGAGEARGIDDGQELGDASKAVDA